MLLLVLYCHMEGLRNSSNMESNPGDHVSDNDVEAGKEPENCSLVRRKHRVGQVETQLSQDSLQTPDQAQIIPAGKGVSGKTANRQPARLCCHQKCK